MHFEDDLHLKRERNIPALRNLFLSCPIYDDFNAQIWRFALLRARRTNLQNLGIANCPGNCSSLRQGHYSFVLGTFLSLFAAAVADKFLKRRIDILHCGPPENSRDDSRARVNSFEKQNVSFLKSHIWGFTRFSRIIARTHYARIESVTLNAINV